MFRWLLIVSITLISAAMMMFVSEFLAILPEARQYYGKSQLDILLLSNSFNIMYIIVAPFLFPFFKRKYCMTVNLSVIMTGLGIVGRYFSGNNFYLALISTFVVAVAQIPIISAPYGLLDLFQESQKGYAASVPLFIPTLGSNFSIIYGMQYITEQSSEPSNAARQINNLHAIIAVLAVISCLLTLMMMHKLKKQIRSVNQQQAQNQSEMSTKGNFVSIIKKQFKGDRYLVIMLACWGAILGINWTYGDMFGVFLKGTGLTHKEMALVGLFANISTVLFSNLGNWITNYLNIPNRRVIFNLNLIGLVSSIFILGFAIFNNIISENKIALILMIIALRAGFCSFVSLALIQLSHGGPSLLVSSIFFYIANISNLGCNYIVSMLDNSASLTILCLLIVSCISFVEFAYGKRIVYENLNKKSQQNIYVQGTKQQTNYKEIFSDGNI